MRELSDSEYGEYHDLALAAGRGEIDVEEAVGRMLALGQGEHNEHAEFCARARIEHFSPEAVEGRRRAAEISDAWREEDRRKNPLMYGLPPGGDAGGEKK